MSTSSSRFSATRSDLSIEGTARLLRRLPPGDESDEAKSIHTEIKRWRLHLRSDLSLQDLAAWVNPGRVDHDHIPDL